MTGASGFSPRHTTKDVTKRLWSTLEKLKVDLKRGVVIEFLSFSRTVKSNSVKLFSETTRKGASGD